MSDRSSPQDVLRELGGDWDAGRTEEQLRAVHQKIQQGARRRRYLQASLGIAAAAAVLLWVGVSAMEPWGDGAGPRDAQATVAETTADPAPEENGQIRLADGSTATPLTAESEVVVGQVSANLAELTVHRGGAVFDVHPNAERRFRVIASNVEVEVLGTRFRVERADGWVEVQVFEGVVRATQQGTEMTLRRGTMHRFDLAEEEPVGPGIPGAVLPQVSAPVSGDVGIREAGMEHEDPHQGVPSREEGAPRERAGSAGPRSRSPSGGTPGGRPEERGSEDQGEAVPSWRELAHDGAFEEAFAALGQGAPPRTVGDLMLAADAARFSGAPGRAVAFLRRVRSAHGADPRAPLAAFTEGRILLLQLGRPQEAAMAFAATRRLAPGAPLAEDAMAREVEALSRAGASAEAERLARSYLARYPEGRRSAAVRHYGAVQ